MRSNSSCRSGKISKLFEEGANIRVYLNDLDRFMDIPIFTNDTFQDVKRQVIEKINNNQEFEGLNSLKCINENGKQKLISAFAFKPISCEKKANFDMPSFDDNSNVTKSGASTVVFTKRLNLKKSVEDVDYRPLGNSCKDSKIFVNLKIYFAYLEEQCQFVYVEEGESMTLKDILRTMNNLPYKNIDLFYFTDHYAFENPEDYFEDDISNEINLDTQLKYLNTHELDVYWLFY